MLYCCHLGLQSAVQVRTTADVPLPGHVSCREVEQYFISNYWLNIPYEREYWIGLAYMPGTAPRKYNWTDKGDDLGKQAYQNWGIGDPNNQAGNENCGVANYSMRTGQQTSGWQDMACSRRFPFICRIKREHHA
jgi:hypothetical protein